MGTVQQLDRDKPKSRCTHWRLWVSDNGVRRSKRFTGSYTQAVRELAAFEQKGREQASDSPKTPLFADYAAEWLEFRRLSGAFKPNTLSGNACSVRALCKTRLEHMRIGDTTPADARQVAIEIQQGRKASSAARVQHAAVMIYAQAVSDGIIERSPFEGLPRPKELEPEKRALTPAEIETTLSRLDALPLDGYTVAVYLMLMLGLRRGEALGVLCEDIDGTTLHVRHQLVFSTNEIGTPKSAAGVRGLPMPKRLIDVLERWRGLMGFKPSERIAVTCERRKINTHAMREWWIEHRDALGCEGMTLHELRHSNLSLMARFMPSPFDLQHWAGWSSLEMARRYIHKDRDAVAVAVAAAFDAPKTHHKTA